MRWSGNAFLTRCAASSAALPTSGLDRSFGTTWLIMLQLLAPGMFEAN